MLHSFHLYALVYDEILMSFELQVKTSQCLRKDLMLIFFPTHSPNIDFATLEQPAFHATSLPLLLIIHSIYVLSSKCTETSLKVQILHLLPYHQNLIRMQWNSIRNRPEECEAYLARSTWNRVRCTWTGEDSVGDEQVVLPMEQG